MSENKKLIILILIREIIFKIVFLNNTQKHAKNRPKNEYKDKIIDLFGECFQEVRILN